MTDNFKLPDELLGGAVKVIRPTDLRNRVGMYMMEERGVKMGRNVDPGDVQDMIVEFTQREIEKLSTGEANRCGMHGKLCRNSDQHHFLKYHDPKSEFFAGAECVNCCYGQIDRERPAPTSVPQAEPKGEQ